MTKSLVLFSGGLDSLVASAKEALSREKVSLLTVDTGVIDYVELSYISYKYLSKSYENVEELIVADGKYLFKKYVIDTLEDDFNKYNYNLVCVGCKLVMYTIALAHALSEDYDYVVDGATVRQSDFPEQKKEVIEWFDKLFDKYGVKLLHPVLLINSKHNIKYEAIRYRLPAKAIEPVCLFGNSFKDNIPVDVIIDYLDTKLDDLLGELESMIKEKWYISKIFRY